MSIFKQDFTKKDLDSLIQAASDYAYTLLPAWTDRTDADLNWVIAKTMAYLVSVGMFYIDLGVNERDPGEVQIYSNALRNARAYGLLPLKASGASTALTLTIDDSPSVFTLPRGTEFTAGSLKYVSWGDASFVSHQTTKDVTVYFGSFVRETLGSSSGVALQSFVFLNSKVSDQKLRVLVNESGQSYEDDPDGFEEWKVVPSLVRSYELDKHVRIELTDEENYRIQFGDGGSGAIPPIGSTIVVEAIELPIDAEELSYGNLPIENIDTCSDATITLVEQPLVAEGGAPRETIQHIGYRMVQYIATGDRAITMPDFEFHAKSVAGVGEAVAELIAELVNLYISPVGGGAASTTLLTAVEDYIQPRMLERYSLNVVTMVEVPIDITVSIVVEAESNRATVKSALETTLASLVSSSGRNLHLIATWNALHDTVGVLKGSVTKHCTHAAGTGVADIELAVNEVVSIGTITVSATGGVA